MTTSKYYQVPVFALNLIVPIRVLDKREEAELYTTCVTKVRGSADPYDLRKYHAFIVGALVQDRNAFTESIRQVFDIDEGEKISLEDRELAYRFVYEAITNLYPQLDIQFVCSDVNTDVMAGILQISKQDLRAKLLGSLGGPVPGSDAKATTRIKLTSRKEIDTIRRIFKDRIIGQDQAVDSLCGSLSLLAAGLESRASMLFVGPTGVGKTEIGRILGDNYSGNFFKINCAEYAQGHEYAKLIGSPPGYVGHSEKSLLAEKAEKSNAWVFLFDEIEKAHHKLYDFLLSLLDDGTCTDNMGQTLDFSNSIFIFTSNKGISELHQDDVGFSSAVDKDTAQVKDETAYTINQSVKNHFSPEFLNRIDEVILFNHLSKKDAKRIAEIHLEDLPIRVTDSLLEFIVANGFSAEYGARNIKRFIKNNVATKIADAFLDEVYPKGDNECEYTPRIVANAVKLVNTEKQTQVGA